MFRGCGDRIIFLHRSDHLDPKPRREIRIFTIDIFKASPALIARNVENRSVNISVAERSAFCGGNASYLANQFFIPRAAPTALRGKTCRGVSSEATNALVRGIHGHSEQRV